MAWLALLLSWCCSMTALAGCSSLAVLAGGDDDFEKLAPWTAVRWHDEVAEVEIGDRYFELMAIDGVKSADVVAFCKKTWPHIWQKRFEEDLVEALTKMDEKVGAKVTLELIDLDSKKTVRKTDVAMTHENRQKLWQARWDREQGAPPRREEPVTQLSRADAFADLDDFARRMRDEYAYYARAAAAFERDLDAAKKALPATIERDDFARRVQALLCLFGDGHTQLSDLEQYLPSGFLPFLVDDTGGRLVAFREDRSAFFDEQHPYLVALDGVAIATWLDAAARLVPRGSPDFVRWHSIRGLRFVAWLRQELALPATDSLSVELADESGARVTSRAKLSSRKPIYGEWPRSRSGLLDGQIACLRIPKMDDDPGDDQALHATMQSFARARGLVIDVRGNGGGSRLLLRELFPWFMHASDPLRVVNVAAYRLHDGDRADAAEGYLADRWLYPLTSREWRADEQPLLQRFVHGFRPAWTPPAKQFSAWHLFALRADSHHDAPHFDGPVVVLQDGGCFSATDVFLGAFKGWRDVTLLGTQSGGGSGRAIGGKLPHSGLEFRVSSMASFRADGSLYDGVGVTPDVVVEPRATDFVGATDTQLDAALARIGEALRARR